jgi:hypothetical protein
LKCGNNQPLKVFLFNMQVPLKPININEIPPIAGEYYENILNVYQTQDASNYFYYNISKKITIDLANVDEQYIEYIFIDSAMPLTTVSYRLFNTIHLWWLIAAMNNLNPIKIPAAGSVLIVPRRQYLQTILQSINQA